jgi:hypothetical protein
MDARVRWLQIEWPTTTTMLELPIYLAIMGADRRERQPGQSHVLAVRLPRRTERHGAGRYESYEHGSTVSAVVLSELKIMALANRCMSKYLSFFFTSDFSTPSSS